MYQSIGAGYASYYLDSTIGLLKSKKCYEKRRKPNSGVSVLSGKGQPEVTVTYDFIKENSSVFPVEKMCQVLEISRSSYYEWKDRSPSKRKLENKEILKIAKKSHEASHGVYGLDKILVDVRETYPKCSRKRLYRILKENQVYSKRKRKFRVTTNSKHQLPVAENLLNQDFKTDSPATVWVADISCVYTEEGWLYLATVKDIFHKEIVGWATADHMRTELCERALQNAVKRHRPPRGLIHHSDRGVQYCSKKYQVLLKKYGMICSMSRKGNCYDNACAETFFSTIKCELIYQKRYRTREEAHKDIFWYIEVFYNRKRRHQALDYLSPSEFKRRSMVQIVA